MIGAEIDRLRQWRSFLMPTNRCFTSCSSIGHNGCAYEESVGLARTETLRTKNLTAGPVGWIPSLEGQRQNHRKHQVGTPGGKTSATFFQVRLSAIGFPLLASLASALYFVLIVKIRKWKPQFLASCRHSRMVTRKGYVPVPSNSGARLPQYFYSSSTSAKF